MYPRRLAQSNCPNKIRSYYYFCLMMDAKPAFEALYVLSMPQTTDTQSHVLKYVPATRYVVLTLRTAWRWYFMQC
jgi:hypothetical protein